MLYIRIRLEWNCYIIVEINRCVFVDYNMKLYCFFWYIYEEINSEYFICVSYLFYFDLVFVYNIFFIVILGVILYNSVVYGLKG